MLVTDNIWKRFDMDVFKFLRCFTKTTLYYFIYYLKLAIDLDKYILF